MAGWRNSLTAFTGRTQSSGFGPASGDAERAFDAAGELGAGVGLCAFRRRYDGFDRTTDFRSRLWGRLLPARKICMLVMPR